MNINSDVHFDGFPSAEVKDFGFGDTPGFCVLRFVDTDQEQHQFFLKRKHVEKARLVAAAFNGDLTELRRLIDAHTLVVAASMRAEDDAEARKPDDHRHAEYLRQKAELI